MVMISQPGSSQAVQYNIARAAPRARAVRIRAPLTRLKHIALDPLVRRVRNPLWVARRTIGAPHASRLLAGVAPAAVGLSGLTCAGCTNGVVGGVIGLAGIATAGAIAGRAHLRSALGRVRDIFSNLVGRSDDLPAASENTRIISLVWTNDTHAYFKAAPRYVGFGNQVRAENPLTLQLDGGDWHEKGHLIEQITEGYATCAVLEAVAAPIPAPGLIVVPGNHDLGYSCEEFLAYTRTPNTIMVCSNMEYVGDDPAEYGGVKYYIVEIGGVRIGFFGMISKGYDERDESTDADYYPDKLRTRHDYEACANEMVAELEGRADVIIMMSHLGIDEDRKLATSVKGLGGVLSAHSHDAIKEVKGGVPIIQADAYGRLIGRLDIVYDLDQGRMVDHAMELTKNDSSVPSDPVVRDKVDAICRQGMPPDNFAQLERALEDKAEIADLAGRAAIQHLKVDAALVDQKTVWRDSWDPGTITLNQLARTFEVEREPAGTPGFSSFYTIEVTGEELNLLRVSGMWGSRWVYNGEGDPQPDQTYTVALPKKAAMHLEHYLNIPERTPTHACEIWEAVYAYGLHRTQEGRYIDSDRPLDDAVPA